MGMSTQPQSQGRHSQTSTSFRAQSVKAGSAELLYAYIDVEPVTFNRGFYTVDVRYFYRITADAFERPLGVLLTTHLM